MIDCTEKGQTVLNETKLDSQIFDYLEKFRDSKMDVEALDELCEKLATAEPQWVKEFIACHGVLWLYEHLAHAVYLAGCALLFSVRGCFVLMIHSIKISPKK